MQIKIAINGFGRIGRCLFRSAYLQKRKDIKIVAINSLPPADGCEYYIKYDSNYGKFSLPVTFDKERSMLNCDGDNIQVLVEPNPETIDWEKYDVDVVLECTGKFITLAGAAKHLRPAMQRVIVSAPMKNAPVTIVYGINQHLLNKEHNIISAGSCTTNCLAPIAKILDDQFGIASGHMTTIHAYTNDQSILDSNHSDLRRSRTAAVSMIPTTTGAAKSIGLVIPSLDGKIDGSAIRVPTTVVSLIDFVFLTKKSTTVEEINNLFVDASKNELQDILDTCEEPLVSVDFLGNTASAIVDLNATKALGNNLYRVCAWYDNEFAFATRMLNIAEFWCN